MYVCRNRMQRESYKCDCTNAHICFSYEFTLNLPVENRQISFDSRIRTGTIFDDWPNANRLFSQLAQLLVHHSMLPVSRPCRCRKFERKKNKMKREINIEHSRRLEYGWGVGSIWCVCWEQRQHRLSVNLPNIDWMLYWTFPVGVFVHNCCENLIQMIPVCVANIGSKYFRPSIGLDAILNIFEIECKISFGPSHSN